MAENPKFKTTNNTALGRKHRAKASQAGCDKDFLDTSPKAQEIRKNGQTELQESDKVLHIKGKTAEQKVNLQNERKRWQVVHPVRDQNPDRVQT